MNILKQSSVVSNIGFHPNLFWGRGNITDCDLTSSVRVGSVAPLGERRIERIEKAEYGKDFFHDHIALIPKKYNGNSIRP
jgi:hypothetical protein